MCLYYLPFYFFTFLLNHPLFTIIYIYTLRCRLRGELAAAEVVPSGVSRMFNVQYSMFNADDAGRFVVIAKVQHEGADEWGVRVCRVRLAGLDVVELEVGSEGVDRPAATGPVEFVPAAKVELGIVTARADVHGVIVAHEADIAVVARDSTGKVSTSSKTKHSTSTVRW